MISFLLLPQHKNSSLVCFCVIVPMSIYVRALTRREKVHGRLTNCSQGALLVGGKLSFFHSLYAGIATCFTMSTYCFCNLKKHKLEKTSGCHLLGMEYKPGTVLTPWQAPSHFILPAALRCGTLIIPQIGKLRLEEDVRLVSGESGSEPGPPNMKAALRLALRCHSIPPALNREKSVCPPWECQPFIPSCFTAEKGRQLLCYGTKAPWGVCCLSWRPIRCAPLSWPNPHVPHPHYAWLSHHVWIPLEACSLLFWAVH